jgi:bacterioferritin
MRFLKNIDEIRARARQ